MKLLRGTPNRLTKSDIENCLDGKAHKLADGGGLYVSADIQGNRYFQFRYFLNGKSVTTQLGKYPEMSLERARELARSRKDEVDKLKEKRKSDSFSKTLKKRSAEDGLDDFYCFYSMEDAGEFVENITNAIARGGHNSDILAVIFLSLLIPSHPSELLSAKRSELSSGIALWKREYQIKSKTARNKKVMAAFLSRAAIVVANIEIKPQNMIGCAFPRLAELDRTSQKKELAGALKSIWEKYPIRAEDFRQFFRAMATRNSFFKPQIIDDAIKHSDASGAINNPSYALQRIALSEWWAQELIRNSNTSGFFR